MRDEIKINTLGQLLDFVETEEKAKVLIDYITNLQQEKEELIKIIQCLNNEYEKLFRHYSIDAFKKEK